LRLKKKELKKAVLKKDLWLYYNGKMTKAEMDKHDWKYDPFDGLSKPMKSDMEKFYSTDSELLELELLLEYDKTYVETCKEILDNIKWRSQTIKNIIITNKAGTTSGYSQYSYDIKGATQNQVIYPSLDPSIFEVKYLNQDIKGKVVPL